MSSSFSKDNHLRSKYVIDTETTQVQSETEDECSPFFVTLAKLPRNQIKHLRQVGLLPPIQAKNDALQEMEVSSNDINTASSSSPSPSGKAAAINNDEDESYSIMLLREKHTAYLTKALERKLPTSYISLDASRPWIVYWTLHSLDLMDRLPCHETLRNVVETMKYCFHEEDVAVAGSTSTTVRGGGFGGGPGQMAHCAPTYAAVLALSIIAGSENKPSVDGPIPSSISNLALQTLENVRCKLYAWFISLRYTTTLLETAQHDGSTAEKKITGFAMHHDGEVDVRGTYTVISICALLNLLTPEITHQVADYICACQTYEGGFGGEPNGGEAHGGYTFCGIAALKLLDSVHLADVEALRGWLARRQMSYEGGFSGRANKLVDGCYSFWQGGAMAVLNLSSNEHVGVDYEDSPNASGMIEQILELDDVVNNDEQNNNSALDLDHVVRADNKPNAGGLLFHQAHLQRYILLCAQHVDGGLRDKPSKPRDFYHSCYNLSGLSVAQHILSDGGTPVVYGHPKNVVRPTHPSFNIQVEKAVHVLDYFGNKYGVPRQEEVLR